MGNNNIWAGANKIQISDTELRTLIDTEIKRGGKSHNAFAIRLRTSGIRIGLPRLRRLWVEQHEALHPYNTYT